MAKKNQKEKIEVIEEVLSNGMLKTTKGLILEPRSGIKVGNKVKLTDTNEFVEAYGGVSQPTNKIKNEKEVLLEKKVQDLEKKIEALTKLTGEKGSNVKVDTSLLTKEE